ncbi:MAG: xanthine dehydrogenase accessory protein XdhC [Myxococcales bacterium]|nr:xanthine dehydrogenase accessory protein XdhC [Myxococcales bacterium]MCB9645468.1 xanthine dehydrogenase accessory protein XdhC [Deltaproteobacteria bacterium]
MADASLFARVAALEAQGARAALVTVVRTSGSAPRAPGARMIVHPDGAIEGTVGGGALEHTATQAAKQTLEDGRPRLVEHNLTQELGMCCGGTVTLFVEALVAQPRLIVFGAGHVGRALVSAAASAGFVVHVADEREALLVPAQLGMARALHDDLDDPALPFSEDTFVMITTHDHGLDQRLAEKCLARPHRWLGVIGSRRKAELMRQRLLNKGFGAPQVARLRAPVGLAIGAETPEEIAVSIVAELVAERRGAVHRDAEGRPEVRPELKTRGGA